MPFDKRTTALLIVWVLAVPGVAATPGLAVGESLLAAAPQDPAAGEASLELQRSTRRLIQQGLHNEGFDPGTPDGLFGPRTRAAIQEWQPSRGASPTGYLNDAEAELLRTAAAPPPATPEAPPPPEAVPAVAPTASSAAAAPASTPTETDPSPASPAMPSVRRTATLPLTFVVCAFLVAGVAATPGVAVGESLAATAPQDPSAVEAALVLDRSTRRLIQQGLRNEGFDPGTPDGLFGPRTRAVIREWQQSQGALPTGYLNGAEAELLQTTAAPRPAASEAPPPLEAVAAVDPSASSAAVASASTPAETDPSPESPATVAAAEEVDAPSASAMCRHASRCGVERGRCRTTRRIRADDVDPQLQQPVAQPRHLAAGTRSTRRPQSQFLHAHVGGGSQEDAQLVRREQTAARAVDLQPIEQFLDPILDIPASTVDLLIDKARRLPQIRHHEPRVVPRLAVSEANDFGLDHDPALVVPRAGGVAGVGIDVRGLATDLALRAGHLHGGLRMPLQHRVLRHRHDIGSTQK